MSIFNAPNKFNGSNNKYKYPEIAELISQDLLEGPFFFDAGGLAITRSQDEYVGYGTGSLFGTYFCKESGLIVYDPLLNAPQQQEVWDWQAAHCTSYTVYSPSLDFSIASNSQYIPLIF